MGPLDDSVPVHYYPEGEAAEAASAAVAIDASNKGFQLLQKMGWKGRGLGRKEDGALAGCNTVSATLRLKQRSKVARHMIASGSLNQPNDT